MAKTTLSLLNETARREIRAEMARQNLTQRELVDRLDWTPAYLRHRLNGLVSFSLDDLGSIANELGVSASRLITAPAAV